MPRVDTRPLQSAKGHFDVTPSDATVFGKHVYALFIGTAGTVRVVARDGSTANYTAPSGAYLYVQAKQVLAAGTDATGIVALHQ